jgi:hypothetical protein
LEHSSDKRNHDNHSASRDRLGAGGIEFLKTKTLGAPWLQTTQRSLTFMSPSQGEFIDFSPGIFQSCRQGQTCTRDILSRFSVAMYIVEGVSALEAVEKVAFVTRKFLQLAGAAV